MTRENGIVYTTAAVLLLTASAVGCGAATPAHAVEGSTATTPVGLASAEHADAAVVDELTGARCDREQTCNNVGDGRKYASRDTCTESIRGDLGNDLNSYHCPRGIKREGLDSCLSAIRTEACSNPLDTLERMEKCRTVHLCLE